MDYSNRKLLIAIAAIMGIIIIGFLVFSFIPNQSTVNNNGAATSTSSTATSTATTTDVKAQPAPQAPAKPKQPGQSAPTGSGIPNDKLTQYWDLFKQGGRCASVGAPKGTSVFSFSGEGAKVSYDGTSPLVKCAVDGNLYVK